ncbi:MAG: hypothetical protein QME45_04275 [Clostridiales bacterium]|nr:hypothetical protein [Clostridiales bacterium]
MMSEYDNYAPAAAKWILPDGTITDKLQVESTPAAGSITTEMFAANAKAPYAGTADNANAVAWANVSGKPSTFAPSAHTHVMANITDLAAVLNAKLTATKAATQADSTATDIAGLVADFNALLAKLKAAGLMA